jgi:hypothetical protein
MRRDLWLAVGVLLACTASIGQSFGGEGLSIFGGGGGAAGPASSTDNAVCRFDGTSGALLQNSGVILDDSNNMSGVGTLASGAITSSGTLTLSNVSTDITTGTNEALTLNANGTGATVLADAVTAQGTITFSGVSTDITTGTNESLVVDANGTGVITIQDDTTFNSPSGVTFNVPTVTFGNAVGAVFDTNTFVVDGTNNCIAQGATTCSGFQAYFNAASGSNHEQVAVRTSGAGVVSELRWLTSSDAVSMSMTNYGSSTGYTVHGMSSNGLLDFTGGGASATGLVVGMGTSDPVYLITNDTVRWTIPATAATLQTSSNVDGLIQAQGTGSVQLQSGDERVDVRDPSSTVRGQIRTEDGADGISLLAGSGTAPGNGQVDLGFSLVSVGKNNSTAAATAQLFNVQDSMAVNTFGGGTNVFQVYGDGLMRNNGVAATCTAGGGVSALTLDPTASTVWLTNDDADGCAVTLSETTVSGASGGAATGVVVRIVVVSNAGGNITFNDAAAVNADGGCTLNGADDSAEFVYADKADDIWVQTACKDL